MRIIYRQPIVQTKHRKLNFGSRVFDKPITRYIAPSSSKVHTNEGRGMLPPFGFRANHVTFVYYP